MTTIEIIDRDKEPTNTTVGRNTNSSVNRLSEMMIKGVNKSTVDKNLTTAVLVEVLKQNPTLIEIETPTDTFTVKEIEERHSVTESAKDSKNELLESLKLFKDFLNNSNGSSLKIFK